MSNSAPKQFVEPRERPPSPLGIAARIDAARIELRPRTVRRAAMLLRRIHRSAERESVAAHVHRVLYAFDPRRVALLLIGGGKTGDDRWYERFVPIADRLYDEHLRTIKREGL